METITKKCIVFKKNGNDPKIIELELIKYHGLFVREVSYTSGIKQFDVFIEHKGFCVNVDTINLDLEKYKESFDAVCADKINALRKIFPNNCILELFKLTKEEELYKEFSKRRKEILTNRDKREKELERKQEEIERLERQLKEKEHAELVKKSVSKWNNNQEVSNIEFLELCKLNNINIHPKTLHFIQVSLVSVSENRLNFKFRKQINSKGKIYTPKCDNFNNVLDELNRKTIKL